MLSTPDKIQEDLWTFSDLVILHLFVSVKNTVFFSPLYVNIVSRVCRWNAFIRAASLSETLYSEFSFTRVPFRPTASCFRKTTWSRLTKVSDEPSTTTRTITRSQVPSLVNESSLYVSYRQRLLCWYSDVSISDSRFPDYGKVELVFSDGPERISGGFFCVVVR